MRDYGDVGIWSFLRASSHAADSCSVKSSTLQRKLRPNALNGLSASRSIQTHFQIKLEEGKLLCDQDVSCQRWCTRSDHRQHHGGVRDTQVGISGDVLSYSSVTYASSQWNSWCGATSDANGMPAFGPECFQYWTVAPYYESQHVVVQPGSASAARTTVLANGRACYALAVAGIKKAQATRPSTTSWVWCMMGYPNNYGCWDMITVTLPLITVRVRGGYTGGEAAAWRVTGPTDVYTGLPSSIGGSVTPKPEWSANKK